MISGNISTSLSSIVNMVNSRTKIKLEENTQKMDAIQQVLKHNDILESVETEKNDEEKTIDPSVLMQTMMNSKGVKMNTPAISAAATVDSIIFTLQHKEFIQNALDNPDIRLHDLDKSIYSTALEHLEQSLSDIDLKLQTALCSFAERSGEVINTSDLSFENLSSMSFNDAIDTLVSLHNRIADASQGQVTRIENKETDTRTSYKFDMKLANEEFVAEYERITELINAARDNNVLIVDISKNEYSSRIANFDPKSWILIDQKV